jgi:hypothetical protein
VPAIAIIFPLKLVETMDFRPPTNINESDEGILESPYRPFYNIFGGNAPILVKQ